MLVDSHCHITFPEFREDREKVIEEAGKEDVLVVNSTVHPKEASEAYALSKKFDNVFWTLGLSTSDLNPENVSETITLARKYKKEVVGLGEVGLDYYWIKDPRRQEIERKNFRAFIELSIELDLPLVVHSRNAEEDCIRILEEYKKPALMHCFSGNTRQAEKAASLRCLISIPTNVVYVKSRQKLAETLDLRQIVLESDSPYLPPARGERNKPTNVKKAAEKIAEIKKKSFDEVSEKTTENALNFFNIRD